MAAFSMDDRRGFANRVCRKFDKFWQWKLPCPVDPFEDIYRAAWDDREWAAMNWIRERKPTTFRQEKYFKMYWGADDHYVTFLFPKGVLLPGFEVFLDEIPDGLVQRKVRSWVCSVNRFRQLRDELKRRVSGVMGNPQGVDNYHWNRRFKDLDPKVNTPKQLYRLWPELQPVMLAEWKRDIQLQSVRSPLPKQLGYQVRREGRMVWTTPEQFRCEDSESTKYERQSFEEINQILLMLSLAEDVPHADRYPLFHGSIWT